MIEGNSIVQEYLAIPLDRMISFQEHIITRLHSVASRSTDSIQWNRLFGMKVSLANSAPEGLVYGWSDIWVRRICTS